MQVVLGVGPILQLLAENSAEGVNLAWKDALYRKILTLAQ